MAKLTPIVQGMTGAEAAQVILENDKTAVTGPYTAGEQTGPLTRSFQDELYYLANGVTTSAAPPSAPWTKITKAGSPLNVDGGAVGNERMKVASDFFSVGDLAFSVPASFFLSSREVGTLWNRYNQGQNDWAATKLIDTSVVKNFVVKATFEPGIGITGFDGDGKFLRAVIDRALVADGYEFTVPDDIKGIIVSTTVRAGAYITPSGAVDANLNAVFDYVADKWAVSTSDAAPVVIVDGFFDIGLPAGTRFQISPVANGHSTGLIDAQANKTFLVNSWLSIPNASTGISGFDANGLYVRSLVSPGNSGVGERLVDFELTVPEDIAFFAVPSQKFSDPTIMPLSVTPVGGSGGTSEEFDAQKLYDMIASGGSSSTTERYLALPRPRFATLNFYGAMPTDMSDARQPTALSFTLADEHSAILVSGKCELSIQGHGSAALEKKGYTFDVFNEEEDSLELKFGGMVATDSFHLKAYATDRTHSRDVASGRMWADLCKTLPYPYSRINNKVYTPKLTGREADLYTYDAQYYTDGFPCAVMLNGGFYGLYTLRLKKKRENYALNNRDKGHIFLDSSTYNAFLGQPFNPANWDLKSPQVAGYVEAGPISDTDVLASINRLWGFLNNLTAQAANHAQFIDLPIWVRYYMHAELIGHLDSIGNNMNLITWDNTHWIILPYDMDHSVGLNPFGGQWVVEATKTGYLIAGDIWPAFRNAFLQQIREAWTDLRTRRIITTERVMSYYYAQISSVPRNVYAQDAARWPLVWSNAEPTTLQMEYYINSRISWLDSVWTL